MPAPPERARLLPTAAAAAGAVLVAAAAAVLLPVVPPDDRDAVMDVLQLVVAGGAAVAAAWRATTCRGRRRATWVAMAAGCAGWAAGQAVWTWYEIALSRPTPFPSAADAGYLVFPAGLSVALWLYPGRSGWRQGRRLLDALTLTAALGVVAWSPVLGPVVQAASQDRLAALVSVAYPAGDLVVLVLTVLLLVARRDDRRGLALLAGGLVAFSLADTAFAVLTATGSFRTGQVVDLGWVAGFALLALAPLASADRSVDVDGAVPGAVSGQAGDTGDAAGVRPAAGALPYLTVVAAVATAGWRQLAVGRLAAGEQVLLGLTVLLVLVRQFVTVRENVALVGVLAAREEQLRHQAFHDGLTGLANRALFADRLEHALALHASDLRPLAVVLCDLDDFKVVNDTLGHAAGDELLVRVAERLRGSLRPADTLARLGGDEFAVLLEHGSDADLVAARLVDALAAPFLVAGTSLRAGASTGVAVVGTEDATPGAGELLVRADTAMYAAKRAGKGQVRVHEPGMSLLEVEEQRLADGLRAALADGAVEVVYQPVVTVATGRVEGLEALARWRWRGQPVPPSVFVPVAERTGLVRELTDAVLDAALASLARWDRSGQPGDLRVGVNVSPQEVADDGLVGRVASALARHGVAADRLVLEVTESALLPDLDAARRTTRALHDLGVRLALDDFGVGYSSLAHLSSIPLRLLKIDRAFTCGLGRDPEQERFVRALLGLGRDLGLWVVAEGVERPEQLDVLRELGCDMAQGYLLARPLPPDEVAALLGAPLPAVVPGQRRAGDTGVRLR